MNAPTPAQPSELPPRRAQLAKESRAAPPGPTAADTADDTESGPDLQFVAALSAEWGWGR
jgi:hypothetical protein